MQPKRNQQLKLIGERHESESLNLSLYWRGLQ
jgi:hypothetical protein